MMWYVFCLGAFFFTEVTLQILHIHLRSILLFIRSNLLSIFRSPSLLLLLPSSHPNASNDAIHYPNQ